MRYSIQPREGKYVKAYGFYLLPEHLVTNGRFKTPALTMLMKLKIEINILGNYFLKILHHFLAAN